jgi:RNA-directed DNA polymerase
LLANIALSALDDHFVQQWHGQMGTDEQRRKRTRTGQGNWRLIRYADLCRVRHKSAYAARRVMPHCSDRCRSVLVVGSLDAA